MVENLSDCADTLTVNKAYSFLHNVNISTSEGFGDYNLRAYEKAP